MIKQGPDCSSLYFLDREGLTAVMERLAAAGYRSTPHWLLTKPGQVVEIVPNMSKKRLQYTIVAGEDVWEEHGDILEEENVKDIVGGLEREGFEVQYSRYFIGNRANIYIREAGATTYYLRIRGFQHQLGTRPDCRCTGRIAAHLNRNIERLRLARFCEPEAFVCGEDYNLRYGQNVVFGYAARIASSNLVTKSCKETFMAERYCRKTRILGRLSPLS